MKVILLDIDGVLTTYSTKWQSFHPDCVAALKKILDNTDAVMVLSSSWRHGFIDWRKDPHEQVSKEDAIAVLKEWFVDCGLPADRLIGFTPDWYDKHFNDHRGTEISLWLKDHPETECFVILDDDHDMEPHGKFHVETREPKGLTMENADQAIKILNTPLTSTECCDMICDK